MSADEQAENPPNAWQPPFTGEVLLSLELIEEISHNHETASASIDQKSLQALSEGYDPAYISAALIETGMKLLVESYGSDAIRQTLKRLIG